HPTNLPQLTPRTNVLYNKTMDALEKLSVLAEQMDLEPAEEKRPGQIPLPMASVDGPARLRQPAAASDGAQAGSTLPCGIPQTTDRKNRYGIYNAVMPDGKVRPLLKTLLTSACERNCYYCPFRAGRNYRRATFKPDEMAKTFMDMQRAGMVDGLFLSSGISKGGVATQDRLLDTADILRNKFHFRGFLHLKIMPGAEREQVRRAMPL